MKKSVVLTLTAIAFLGVAFNANGQERKTVERKTERKVEQKRVERKPIVVQKNVERKTVVVQPQKRVVVNRPATAARRTTVVRARPVYNAKNPSWRYAHVPRRNTVVVNVSSGYRVVNYGGYAYRYRRGVWYKPYNSSYIVVGAPYGIFINTLPVGYRTIYVNKYPYYYYNGAYYDKKAEDNYTVVSPPVGAIVESIPDGYETVVIDGETYYTIDGAQYKAVVQDNGEIWYQVIKAN